jgi:hypothetical protein
MLEEKDLLCVRDLYKKLKTILSQENAERIFGITDGQLLALHKTLDRRFEKMISDNLETDELMKAKR